VRNGRGFWQARKVMRDLGFASTSCGPDGPDAWKKAEQLNAAWRKARLGLPTTAPEDPSEDAITWPRGSVGEGFKRFRRTETWKRKEPRTHEDWWRGWRYIKPVFGDVDPETVELEQVDAWYWEVHSRYGLGQAYRAMKTWRALWAVLASLGYCIADADPSQAVRRETPKPRHQTWNEGEVVRLVKHAVRRGYPGLACCVAVAWDTQFSPVDVRTLSGRHLAQLDSRLAFLGQAREKTDRPVIGTLSRRTERLVRAYLKHTYGDVTLLPDAPLFRTRGLRKPGPQPYSKDTLGDDFRDVRNEVFPGDDRTIMDMRRSGAVEASAGGVELTHLAAKMGNTVNRSGALQKTYMPVDAASVKAADEARRVGRRRTRGGAK
jgi:hypothetical protein